MKNVLIDKKGTDSRDFAKILAIILNWNELRLTRRCIKSLLGQKNVKFDILVVDNNSVVNPTDNIISEFSNIHVIRNKENYGVAGGRNIGIHFAIRNRYKYILLFDNDAYADKGMLSHLLKAAVFNPDTAVFGPKIFVDGTTNVIWRAGCTSWKWTYLHAGFEIIYRFCSLLNKKMPLFFDTSRGANQFDKGQYDNEEAIVFQIGCAQFIRTDIFEQVGRLDEEFSPYGSEDIDFCARVLRLGWKIKYIPNAVCWHRDGSCRKDDYNRSFFNTRNILLLARKNLHPLYLALLFIPDFIFLTIPLIIIEGLFFRQKNRLKGVFSGIKWNLADIKNRGFLLRNVPK